MFFIIAARKTEIFGLVLGGEGVGGYGVWEMRCLCTLFPLIPQWPLQFAIDGLGDGAIHLWFKTKSTASKMAKSYTLK